VSSNLPFDDIDISYLNKVGYNNDEIKFISKIMETQKENEIP
jgi:hypothetical protein